MHSKQELFWKPDAAKLQAANSTSSLSAPIYQLVPVDGEQVEIARSAWRKYGKGRHLAALNFGDCFAYALAKSSGEPLLAKGTDFALTDIEVCRVG